MMIRKANQQDICNITAIYQEIHSAEESGMMVIGWTRDIYPTECTALRALERGDLFVMYDDGRVVGSAIINQTQAEGYEKGTWKYQAEDQDIMVLHTLVISPSAGHKGYGRAFEQFYETYALENGCHFLRIDTNARNERARKFYQRLGFSEAGIVRTPFNGLQEVKLVLLEKKLCEIHER